MFCLAAAVPRVVHAQAPSSEHASSAELRWNEDWPRFRTWEYVATPALLAGAFGVRFFVDPPSDANWRGGILFDDSLRRELAVDHPSSAYDVWKFIGDTFYRSALVYPALDPFFAAGIARGNWDVTGQILMMNLEAFALTSSILWFGQLAIRRERPDAEPCGPDDREACDDDTDARRSFPGGHVAVVTTTAALTCLHHSQLPLYGGGFWDGAACGAWITGAAATFASRVLTERHYFSDNVAGVAVGLLSGWLVPYLLHYGASSESLHTTRSQSPGMGPFRSVSVLPMFDDGELTLQIVATNL